MVDLDGIFIPKALVDFHAKKNKQTQNTLNRRLSVIQTESK